MAKRNKNKRKAPKYSFLKLYTDKPQKASSHKAVKGQKKLGTLGTKKQTALKKNANILAKARGIEAGNRDIIKSVSLAIFILSLELVLYLTWR